MYKANLHGNFEEDVSEVYYFYKNIHRVEHKLSVLSKPPSNADAVKSTKLRGNEKRIRRIIKNPQNVFIESFIYPTDAKIDCSKNVKIYITTCMTDAATRFGFHHHHQRATVCALLKL